MICNYDLLSFQILGVDRVTHPNGSFIVKARPFAALSFRLGGKGVFEIDGKRLVANESDVMFLPADKSYKVDYSFSEYIVVHLSGCNYTEAEIIEVSDHAVIEVLFVRLLDGWSSNRSINQAKALVYEILYKLSESRAVTESRESSELERCVQYLSEHFCESELSVESLCRNAYVSRSSLQRYFLRRFDTSPKQYILKLRMAKAMELLSQNDCSITEVAAACGFSDVKYFSRIFKQTYGIPPSHLRPQTLI